MMKPMNSRYPQNSHFLFSLILRLKKVNSHEGGFVIFITIGMVLLLGFLWTASALVSKVDTARARASEGTNSGFYAAEYGLNKRAQQVRSRFEGYNLPSGTSPANWQACLDSNNPNHGSGDFQCQTDTLTASDSSQGSQRVTSLMKADPNNPMQKQIPSGEPYAGLYALEYKYTVDSVASNTNRLNLPSAILGLDFQSRLVPLFQFAIFYDDDADFTIPPDMTINGRIHTNGNLYLNASSNRTLSINGIVTAAGVDANGVPKTSPLQPLIRGEKSNESQQCAGTVRLMRDRNNGWQNLNCSGNARTRYASSTTTPSNISTWGANLQLGVPKLTVPQPGEFAPSAGRTYWDSADLRLVLNVVNDNTKPSGTKVSNIEVENSDGSQNTTATAALNACSAIDLAGNAITTNLTANAATSDTSLSITTNTANKFNIGDALIVGDDWDGNVVIDQNATVANTGTISSLTGSTLYLRQTLRDGTGQTTGAVVKKAVVSSSDTFYNYREKYTTAGAVTTGGAKGQYIRMLNVDVRQLLNCAYNQPSLMNGRGLNDTTEGGLVWYLTVKDNTGNTNNFRKYGIRLYNGRSLASTIPAAPQIAGLTVVSNQAVYIQGDYNLKNDNTTTPATTQDDPTTTSVTEAWHPAAILADSINILSNRWRLDDFNSTRYTSNLPENQDTTSGKLLCTSTYITNTCDESLTSYGSPIINPVTQAQVNAQTHRPPAWQTWVNAAFLAGTVSPASEGSSGTGGVNNYPRFHEFWNTSSLLGVAPYTVGGAQVPFNYRGSFVSLFQPSYTTAPFCGSFQPTNCNIYSPPVRNWDYESTAGVNNAGFNDANNLPPLSPRAVYLRQEVFRRSYDRASLNSIPNPFAFLPSPTFNFGLTLPSQR